MTDILKKGWLPLIQKLGLSINPVSSLPKEVLKPILSADDILEFTQELEGIAAKLPVNSKQSSAMRQGELSSRFMGAGMEYEESRPYAIGDEIRRFNWRLMARTGKAYTKLFQEERQENWMILLDHRSSMRFGTRKRLKATQASRVAGYYAWLAQQAGIPVSLGRLTETFEQSPIFEGRSSYSHIMQAASHACPPVIGSTTEANLNDVLLSLSHQLQPGSRLIIISDFLDMNNKTHETLAALQHCVLIKAVLIEDEAEKQIPCIDDLKLQSSVNSEIYQLNTKQQREGFAQWSESHFANITQQLQASGASVYEVATSFELNEINSVLSETSSQAYENG